MPRNIFANFCCWVKCNNKQCITTNLIYQGLACLGVWAGPAPPALPEWPWDTCHPLPALWCVPAACWQWWSDTNYDCIRINGLDWETLQLVPGTAAKGYWNQSRCFNLFIKMLNGSLIVCVHVRESHIKTHWYQWMPRCSVFIPIFLRKSNLHNFLYVKLYYYFI